MSDDAGKPVGMWTRAEIESLMHSARGPRYDVTLDHKDCALVADLCEWLLTADPQTIIAALARKGAPAPDAQDVRERLAFDLEAAIFQATSTINLRERILALITRERAEAVREERERAAKVCEAPVESVNATIAVQTATALCSAAARIRKGT